MKEDTYTKSELVEIASNIIKTYNGFFESMTLSVAESEEHRIFICVDAYTIDDDENRNYHNIARLFSYADYPKKNVDKRVEEFKKTIQNYLDKKYGN